MLPFVAQNHPHGTFAHFWGIHVHCFAHDAPSYSGVGASGKPGAVQKHITCLSSPAFDFANAPVRQTNRSLTSDNKPEIYTDNLINNSERSRAIQKSSVYSRTRLDWLSKALAAGPDWVALDLEGGVGPGDKCCARQALDAFASGEMCVLADRIAVRINTLSSPEGIQDIAAMLDWPTRPGMEFFPKVSAPSEVAHLMALAASCGRAAIILVTLETAAGIACADQIARALPNTAVISYGSADHMAETGGEMSEASLAWARGQIVNAAAMAGVPAMDGVWLDFRDTVGLKAEAQLVKSLGFAGKIAIHPDQIAAINAVFSPTTAEIATARDMLAASDAAGGGAFSYNGKMIDAPVLARARRIMEITDRSDK